MAGDESSEVLAAGRVPVTTRLGPVRIGVTEPERALVVWRDLVGLSFLGEADGALELGVGDEVLIILEPGQAPVQSRENLGLYHVAIHVPQRRDLAVVIARLATQGYYNAPTRHLATETTYLWDLDGNGIEITFETGEQYETVMRGTQVYGVDAAGNRRPGVAALDVQSVLGELGGRFDPLEKLPAGTRVGHVNLHIADLDASMHFYSDVLGFPQRMLNRARGNGDVVLDFPPHIIAFNLWAGPDARQPPPGSIGLRYFTVTMPDAGSFAAIRDRVERDGAPLTEIAGGFETADPAGNRVQVVRRQATPPLQ